MIEVTGAEQLAALSKRLKDAGERGLQRELNKGIREAVEPFREAFRQSALNKLPRKGGLAQRVVDQVIPRPRKINSSKGVGLRVIATGKAGMRSLAALDAGRIRHPVFNTDRWVSQLVQAHVWSQPAEELGPKVTKEVRAALDRVARKIDGGL